MYAANIGISKDQWKAWMKKYSNPKGGANWAQAKKDNAPFPKDGVANDSDWAHGTHVAGILAATTNNGLGMASAIFNVKY